MNDIISQPSLTFKPTFLYIKKHSVTGKLYFGKTSNEPEKYTGSGSYWLKHIKKHGFNNVETVWFCLFYDRDECNKFACLFSEQENIVESNAWANLVPENGLQGGANKGFKHTFESKAKMSESQKAHAKDNKKPKPRHSEETKLKLKEWQLKNKPSVGLKRSEKTKLKMHLLNIGENNPNFGKHWINNGADSKLWKGEIPLGWKVGKSDQLKEKIKNSRKPKGLNKYWFTNGIIAKMLEECPVGWVAGKKIKEPKIKKTKIKQIGPNVGKRWCNNGIEEKLTREIPNEWILGRLTKVATFTKTHTEETKQKMRDWHKKQKEENLANGFIKPKSKPRSEETKRKISEGHQRRKELKIKLTM